MPPSSDEHKRTRQQQKILTMRWFIIIKNILAHDTQPPQQTLNKQNRIYARCRGQSELDPVENPAIHAKNKKIPSKCLCANASLPAL